MTAPAHVQQIERQLRAMPAEALRALAGMLSRAPWHTERGRPAEALETLARVVEILERAQ
jgi:hypothetical protein